MIGIHEALKHCLASVPGTRSERVNTADALGRVLAEDVVATSPIPPWDNSAMDGYAIQAADTHTIAEPDQTRDDCAKPSEDRQGAVPLRVIETVAAGSVGRLSVESGQATRIMTGAPIPAGVDAVVMREHTSEQEHSVLVHRRVAVGANIRRQGEDVAAGTTVLKKGMVITPAAMGLCASVGRGTLSVSQRPTVAIISTGDELVPPGSPLGPGQIHSSNTHALMGLIQQAGADPIDIGLIPDDLTSTRNAFQRACECDLIVSTGGVSVGDYDLVRQAMGELGADMQFWKVRIKPGKPLAYGVIHHTPTFGLPGNPVSCQVGFLQFVRPWIRMALGDPHPYLPVVQANMAEPYTKKAGRAELCRVVLSWENNAWSVTMARTQSSGSQTSMVIANGLLLLSEDAFQLQSGDSVTVQVIRDVLKSKDDPGYPWS